MSNQLITNQEKLLSEVINDVLTSTKSLNILVGYFYFSGFKQIYKQVKDKQMRVLIGLDIERGLGNAIKEFEIIQEDGSHISGKTVRENCYKSIVEIFNKTDYFDSPEAQEAFNIFLDKIANGTLEIKKTREPNHAKLYLFENKKEYSQGGNFPGTMITGSSNLTRSGLKDRFEINVIFRDENYIKAKKIFDELWKSSVPVADKDYIQEFIDGVVDNIWLNKLPKPFLLYIRVLEEYLSIQRDSSIRLPVEITNNRYYNLKYQIDAIQQALTMIKKHDGVIVSDVVGLGKSIIASAVAHNLGLKTIIISPPHLKEQWEGYRFEFNFNAKVYGNGTVSINKALEENLDSDKKLILVDEAHKFRNEITKDYANLHKLCQGNVVILLTATPFSNKPQDIFSMIKLFQIPGKSTIKTIDNLSLHFRELVKEYKSINKSQKEKKQTEKEIEKRVKGLSNSIRDIISPLVIRRSRLDLEAITEYKEDLKVQGFSFPKVKDPKMLDYDLGELSELYKDTLLKIAPQEELKGFIGARYKPTSYLKDREKYKKNIEKEFGDENLFIQSQKNLAKFMKRLLVRRFESSINAFRKTLDSMITSSERVRDWYYKGKVPIYKKGDLPDFDYLFETTDDDISDELEDINYEERLKKYEEKGLQIIDARELRKSFIKDVESDISLLEEIREEWTKEKVKSDPKVGFIISELNKQIKSEPQRKIVIFTEFADTANYLFSKLQDSFKVLKFTSADSNLVKKQIKSNFDASIPENQQKNDFDILIATDAISEGYNLHRAGAIVNYDIPYNPTRVIQRVGRINRINKKVFDELYIYNFFPTSTGEKEIRAKQISTLKIAIIGALLGEDTKVLTSEEILQSFNEQFRKEIGTQEELSWDANFRNELNRLKSHNAKVIEQALNIPQRVRIKRTVKKDKKGVILFGKKGEEYAFKLGINSEECQAISASDALEIFKAESTEQAEQVSNKFEEIYQFAKQNLFIKKTEVPKDKGRIEAINKIEVLLQKLPKKKEYFEDLLYVLEQLDSLPDFFSKQIRAISEKTLEKDVKNLQQEITHQYLLTIIKKEKLIDEGEESLILAEELI